MTWYLLKFMTNETTLIDIINFLFWDGDVRRATSCDVYISQYIRFVRASSQYFNNRNKI